MRKYLVVFILFLSLCSFAQLTPRLSYQVANATTVFGVNVAIGVTVYDVNTNKYYICKTASASTLTLTTGAANFTLLGGTGVPMVWPGTGIPASTGSAWGTSITDASANWNTAYGWGNHASAGYITAANLTLNASTGVVSNSGGTGFTLPVFTSANSFPGLVYGSNGVTTGYLRGDGVWDVIPVSFAMDTVPFQRNSAGLRTMLRHSTDTLILGAFSLPIRAKLYVGGNARVNGAFRSEGGLGDITGATTINSVDAIYLATYLSGHHPFSLKMMEGDLNRNGVLDLDDAALMLAHFAQIWGAGLDSTHAWGERLSGSKMSITKLPGASMIHRGLWVGDGTGGANLSAGLYDSIPAVTGTGRSVFAANIGTSGTDFSKSFNIKYNTGYVGILTGNPQAALDINGGLKIRSVPVGTHTDSIALIQNGFLYSINASALGGMVYPGSTGIAYFNGSTWGTSATTTVAQLNYLNAATGTTGTTSTNLVYSTSPSLVTPALGVATATSISTPSIISASNVDIVVNPGGTGGLKLTDLKTATFNAVTANTSSSGDCTIDWTLSNIQKFTLTENTTISFVDPIGPCSLTLIITHAANTSTYTCDFYTAPINWLLSGGTPYSPTQTSSAKDILSIIFDGTDYDVISINDFK